MDSIASTAFGIDIDSQNQQDDPFVANVDRIFERTPKAKIMFLIASMYISIIHHLICDIYIYILYRLV